MLSITKSLELSSFFFFSFQILHPSNWLSPVFCTFVFKYYSIIWYLGPYGSACLHIFHSSKNRWSNILFLYVKLDELHWIVIYYIFHAFAWHTHTHSKAESLFTFGKFEQCFEEWIHRHRLLWFNGEKFGESNMPRQKTECTACVTEINGRIWIWTNNRCTSFLNFADADLFGQQIFIDGHRSAHIRDFPLAFTQRQKIHRQLLLLAIFIDNLTATNITSICIPTDFVVVLSPTW